MHRTLRTAALTAALLTTTGSAAHALVFAEKSPEQKLRADIGKQTYGYLKCLGKALVACEKTGTTAGPECTVENGVATGTADPKNKFAAAVAKCAAKLDFARKTPRGLTSQQGYQLLGCPSYGLGFEFSGLEQYAQFLELAKPFVDSSVSNMPLIAGCTDAKSCANAAKVLLDFLDALGRCRLTCEDDYKNKKGNGGPTDDPVQCSGSGDVNVQACRTRATNAFLKKAKAWPFANAVLPGISPVVDQLGDELWNTPDQCG